MITLDNQETVILDILNEKYPDLDATPGTPFYELVVRPMAYLWTRHLEGAAELTTGIYLSNYSTMPTEDLDRLMSTFFLTRKVGDYVYANVRIVLNDLKDYYIPSGLSMEKDNYTYSVTADAYVPKLSLGGNAIDGYYIDVGIVSDGTSNVYNLIENDTLTTTDASLAPYVKKIYVLEDSSDGGVSESNSAFYTRAQRSLSLHNLTTYRGVTSDLFTRFNVRAVLPVGLRDDELQRDLITFPGVGTVHRGGMADIYVRPDPYFLATGYRKPLGFPYALGEVSLATDADALVANWNALTFSNVDIYTRGSMKESISNLSAATDMVSLTSNISAIHDYCSESSSTALHSDNLVKQMWPLVVKVSVNIPATVTGELNGVVTQSISAEDQVSIAKDAIVNYINNLPVGSYPKISNLTRAVIAAGVSSVSLPIVTLKCYYLTENLEMQWIGINGERSSSTSLLKPVETDSLKFTVTDNTQVSIRNCVWYTNANLVEVKAV